jgi:hypothetical protein
MAVIHTTACEELIRQIEALADPGDLGPDEVFSTASSIAQARDFLHRLYEQEDDSWPRAEAGAGHDSGVLIRWGVNGRGAMVQIPGESRDPRWLWKIKGGLESTIVGEVAIARVLELLKWVCGKD